MRLTISSNLRTSLTKATTNKTAIRAGKRPSIVLSGECSSSWLNIHFTVSAVASAALPHRTNGLVKTFVKRELQLQYVVMRQYLQSVSQCKVYLSECQVLFPLLWSKWCGNHTRVQVSLVGHAFCKDGNEVRLLSLTVWSGRAIRNLR